jgi:hypothetical protein
VHFGVAAGITPECSDRLFAIDDDARTNSKIGDQGSEALINRAKANLQELSELDTRDESFATGVAWSCTHMRELTPK